MKTCQSAKLNHHPILRWPTSRLAWDLGVPMPAIDATAPLAEMGVQVRALSLAGAFKPSELVTA